MSLFSSIEAVAGLKSMEIDAVIIKADGRRIDLGTVNRWHRNPLIRFWQRFSPKGFQERRRLRLVTEELKRQQQKAPHG